MFKVRKFLEGIYKVYKYEFIKKCCFEQFNRKLIVWKKSIKVIPW